MRWVPSAISAGDRTPLPDDRPPHSPRFGQRLLLIGAVLALLLFAVSALAPPRAGSDWEAAYGARYVLVLAFIVLGLAAARQSLSVIASQLLICFAIMVVLVGGYSYRGELQEVVLRLSGELVPARGTETAPGVVSFRRAGDGQFWIEGEVDGQRLRFLLDTGSSGVVLSRRDAERLGYDLSRLSFDLDVETANGRTHEAAVTLDQLRIGSLHFTSVPAAVNAGGLRDSLLGMRLLERLGSIEIRKDVLTIRQ